MAEQTNAIVTAVYGTRLKLRVEDGRNVDARIKGRRLKPVCGDRVRAAPLDSEPDWLITGIGARRNELTRPNQRGRAEVLAANLDFLAVVCAAVPRPDWFVVDRYLCAAELMRVAAAVIFNKIDEQPPDDAAARELANYRAIGYDTVECSARTGRNLDELGRLLAGRLAIVVGQSGVGKSSLIGELTGTEQRTAEVSAARREGRHTTVNTVMLALPQGGHVVDSPGVRDYAPVFPDAEDVEAGFREIRELGRDCRFGDCRHRREPDCAVKMALERGGLAARRYESYKRMRILAEQQRRGGR